MGAVRVKVKITNGGDEMLARTGQLRPEDVRSYEGMALADTGAVNNVIPASVAKALGLPALDRVNVKYADGRSESVDEVGPIMLHLLDRRTIGDVLGEEILIGQIALGGTDLHVDCNNQRLIPNPEHPDRPTFRV